MMEYVLARYGNQDKIHLCSRFQNHHLMKPHEPTQYEPNNNHPHRHFL
jgi:hypothetical protein